MWDDSNWNCCEDRLLACSIDWLFVWFLFIELSIDHHWSMLLVPVTLSLTGVKIIWFQNHQTSPKWVHDSCGNILIGLLIQNSKSSLKWTVLEHVVHKCQEFLAVILMIRAQQDEQHWRGSIHNTEEKGTQDNCHDHRHDDTSQADRWRNRHSHHSCYEYGCPSRIKSGPRAIIA